MTASAVLPLSGASRAALKVSYTVRALEQERPTHLLSDRKSVV